MSLPDRILDLQQKRMRILDEYEKLERALADGTITQPEHDYLLSYQYGGLTKEQQLARIDERIALFKRHAEAEPQAMAESQPVLQTPARQERAKMPSAGKPFLYILLAFGILAIAALFANMDGGITGFAVYDVEHTEQYPIETLYGSNTTITLNVTALTGLLASGTLVGDGSARLVAVIDGNEYVIAEVAYEPPPFEFTTEKAEYTLGETVTVSLEPAPESVTYYAYVGEEAIPFDGSFVPGVGGDYRVDAIITSGGEVLKLSTGFMVVAPVEMNITGNETTNASWNESGGNEIAAEEPDSVAGTADEAAAPPETQFTDACIETCDLEAYTGDVLVRIEMKEAELQLDRLALEVLAPNSAPVQVTPLPDIGLVNGTATIDLAQHFADPDGDVIIYEVNNIVGIEETLDDALLTLSGSLPGSYETYVYASDLSALTQSNTFTVIVPEAGIDGDGNATGGNRTDNTTKENVTNESATGPAPAGPALITDCSDPDPNMRPLHCLQEQAEYYFQPQSILLEDLDRVTAGRITPIGNLMIKGDIVEQSTGKPSVRAFVVSKSAGLGETVPVAWVDRESGDLHIAGLLYEEELAMVPSKGSYAIQNAQSITIAYIDRSSGDLHIRGNLIPYRRSLEAE